jgi:hypothetical protein
MRSESEIDRSELPKARNGMVDSESLVQSADLGTSHFVTPARLFEVRPLSAGLDHTTAYGGHTFLYSLLRTSSDDSFHILHIP